MVEGCWFSEVKLCSEGVETQNRSVNLHRRRNVDAANQEHSLGRSEYCSQRGNLDKAQLRLNRASSEGGSCGQHRGRENLTVSNKPQRLKLPGQSRKIGSTEGQSPWPNLEV